MASDLAPVPIEAPVGRRRSRSGDLLRSVIVLGTMLVVFYLVIVPIFFLVFGSVFTGRPGQEGTLSVDVYSRIFSDPRSYRLMGLSLVYALGSSLISFVFGVAIAWLLQRTDVAAKPFLIFVAVLPLFVPTLLFTIGWILLLDPSIGVINSILRAIFGFETGPLDLFSFPGMIWIKGINDIPLVALWLWPAFGAMDPGLEEAGAASGASPRHTFRSITLPLVRPALLAALVISFVSSLEDVTVPALIGLPDGITVFASEIWLASSRTPTDLHAASAYAVILLVITVVLVVFYRRLTMHHERFVTVRGRGYRPSVVPLGSWRKPAAILLGAFLFFIVVLPLLMLLWMSLQPYSRAFSFDAFGSLSTRAYQTLTTNRLIVEGLRNSAILGVATAVIVMFIALVIGWIVVRTSSWATKVIDIISFTPIAIPGLVIGVSLIWLYLTLPAPIPIYGTALVLLIAYATRLIPYGVRLSYAGFTQIHPELEEAGATSGSSWAGVMRKISLPLMAPTIAVGMIYVFIRAFGETPASLLLFSFGNRPYSVVAFNLWIEGEIQTTAAYGVLAIALMLVVALVLYKTGGGSRIMQS